MDLKRGLKNLANLQLNNGIRNLFTQLMKRGMLKTVLSVSNAPLAISRIYEHARKYGVSIGVLRPANAFDPILLRYRKEPRNEPVAVFYGRLTPEKGIYDLLYTWRYVNGWCPKAKLKVIGSFPKESYRRAFFNTTKKLGLKNVEYLGYISQRNSLWKEVSKAKALLYPSHRDAFPLVILESLAMGLTVIAYDTPAIRSVYKGLPAVFTAKEGSIGALAKHVIKVLTMDSEKLNELHESIEMRRFLKLHSSWSNVAKAEFNYLQRLVK